MIVINDVKLNTGDHIDEHGLVHHRRADGTFDIAEHGNAGVKSFLDYDIELSQLTDLINEITANTHDLMFVFGFEDNNLEGLYITEDGFWIAPVAPIDFSDPVQCF